MKLKYRVIANALKLVKPISQLYNKVKNVIPKSKRAQQSEEIAALRSELNQLKSDLNRANKKIVELSNKGLEEKQEATNSTEWIQAELYTSKVQSGKDEGSEAGGYILVNMPLDEWKEYESKFFGMDAYKIKSKLNMGKDEVLKSVSKGVTTSDTKERFLEINGQREALDWGALL